MGVAPVEAVAGAVVVLGGSRADRMARISGLAERPCASVPRSPVGEDHVVGDPAAVWHVMVTLVAPAADKGLTALWPWWVGRADRGW